MTVDPAPKPQRLGLPELVAWIVVHHPRILVAALCTVLICGGWIVKVKGSFDSEVLNLLPDVESVRALGEMNHHFTHSRELTFVLEGDPETSSAFEQHFLDKLRAEPWVVRVFSGPPFEVAAEMEVLQELVPSLLLNLDDAAFRTALTLLEPQAIADRMHHLRQKIEAGSSVAEFQLATDPLGLLGAAIKPVSTAYGEDRSRGPGGNSPLRVVPVMTNQTALDLASCTALMAQVDAFQRDVMKTWKGPAPEVQVTGRSAYVTQMSASMQRDIQLTSTISILAVSALFFLSFRRVLPLLGLTLILGISCFMAFALGCVFFSSLNMISVAFCSILVGLGDDFSLLLYNRYLHGRQKHQDHETAIANSIRDVGSSICYVAVTTGVGFLALIFSGSAGFAQLGLLIAAGLVLCAGFMILLLFLFIRPQLSEKEPDPLHNIANRYLSSICRLPAPFGAAGFLLLLGLTVFALLPVRPLSFDTNPRSLEPPTIPASVALGKIRDAFPDAAESVILMMKSREGMDSHALWEKMTNHLQQLVEEGELKSFSSPGGLIFSQDRQRRNQEALQAVDLDASLLAFDQALVREGLNPDALAEGREVFGRLKDIRTGLGAFRSLKNLVPPQSSWWFLIDRGFSSDSKLAAAYLKPARAIVTADDQHRLERRIAEAGVPVVVSGWNYAMIALVPWAERELLVFGGGVCALIVVMLGLAYKDWRPWLLHTGALVFALGATVASLKFADVRINLLNAMAFPLILGVGVDYGLHLLLAFRKEGDSRENLEIVLKPVVICALTTITGFGSLIFASNPALSGLGLLCAIGVFWCLATSLIFLLPVSHLFLVRKRSTTV